MGAKRTDIVETLFGKILKLPTALVDITTYSETGYVGQDPSTILTRLLHTADENPMLASIGIVCLDEFDKIASGQNNAIFAGSAGTTKDVTGMGVQRELLKIITAFTLGHTITLLLAAVRSGRRFERTFKYGLKFSGRDHPHAAAARSGCKAARPCAAAPPRH